MTGTQTTADPTGPAPDTGRVQLALNVDRLEESVAFYTRLLGVPPAKLRPGYANFAVASPPLKLVLLENPGRGSSINHLGIEVAGTQQVHSEIARLTAEGLVPQEELGTTCCFATQDKVWVTGPGGERWEVYTVLADSPTFGCSPQECEGDADASATRQGTATRPHASAACC